MVLCQKSSQVGSLSRAVGSKSSSLPGHLTGDDISHTVPTATYTKISRLARRVSSVLHSEQ